MTDQPKATMKGRRPARLRKLRVSRVDRVDSGANPDAHIVLFKSEDGPASDAPDLSYSRPDPSASERPPSEESPMSDQTTPVATDDAEARIAAAEAERDLAIAKAADAEAALAAATAAPESTDEPTEDEVMKSLDPAVRERIVKAETERAELAERVAKMEDERLTAVHVAKAAEFATVAPDTDALGAALKDVAKSCSPETVALVESVLKSATDRVVEANRLVTAELGSAQALDASDTGRQIESLAKARADKTGEAFEVAQAAVLDENPGLYEQFRAERAN